ncbi:ras-related protein Rab-13-like [Rhopilema esculentum]|uniref:ras-related protein Rab-13-like n=1 Tax=Rhopilema esculentum TaxID=499914 RepID=UPI0031DD0F05
MSFKRKQHDVTYKVLVLGESTVGKTALIKCYTEKDKDFNPNLVPTIGIDYKTEYMTIDKLKIRVQIWDTAGQERFRTMNAMYYRGAKGILLVYDVTNKDSYLKVKDWMEDLKQHDLDKEEIILIGNKIDLEHLQEVASDEGNKLAMKYGIKFMETSAKTGENVNETFTKLVYNMKDSCDPFTVSSDVGNEDWEAVHRSSHDTNASLNLKQSAKKNGESGSGWCCPLG